MVEAAHDMFCLSTSLCTQVLLLEVLAAGLGRGRALQGHAFRGAQGKGLSVGHGLQALGAGMGVGGRLFIFRTERNQYSFLGL